MLTVEEREEIDAKLADYPNTQAVAIEAMLIIQRRQGWVSDEKLRDLSEILRLSVANLDGVATFYNLIRRRPVGRHVALVCDSVSCWIMGSDRMRDHLCSKLGTPIGGTTSDGQFTLLPIVCLGACDHAPAMMIDGTLHEDLNEQKIEEILTQYT
ncbi:NADH-quinone oxidoreductase subunit NuoE [Terriglobus albidus]|uniref:NADH-quinone oxidoreductase subunit NuoE n=1 Tax=Terriglobus albidus TaxID=1592106 RepID=A0A5B9EDF8_9BACT|nr:NADH-quinone oxidoreductase subunit NuoE [Terriglobus albidus]QEE28431.1 NADH-quinone oxidoreductase subunit NuoE [Terriglobus albidus]